MYKNKFPQTEILQKSLHTLKNITLAALVYIIVNADCNFLSLPQILSLNALLFL